MRVSSLAAVLAVMLGCSDKATPTAKAPAPPAPPDAAEAPAAPDDRMDTVSKLYDRADYAGAAVGAEAILRDEPDNIRMLRIAVSSYCLLGDGGDRTRQLWRKLPPRDQQQMSTRCERVGITLP